MKRIWIIPVIIVIILWSVNLVFYLQSSDDDIGKFGDVFGAVNSLFSGLAFAGIIISIHMQRRDLQMQNKQLTLQSKELKLQRKELKLQREELEDTRLVLEGQSKLMDDQRNDATFFNLLANHRQMIESLRTSTSKFMHGGYGKKYGALQEPVSGYQVVEVIANEWITRFELYSKMYVSKDISVFENITYNPVKILNSSSDLITIFKEVLNVYDFVNSRFENHPQKQFYKDTLWTNLSHSEKFIFEAYLYNFSGEQINRNHRTDIYESYNFIDFNTCSIQDIIVFKDEHINMPKVKIKHNAKILKVIFFSFKEDYSEDSIKLKQATEITKPNPELGIEILINDAILSVNDKVNEIPFSDSKALGEYKYGILCQFLHNGEKFKVCFGVNLRCRFTQTPELETECQPEFNGNSFEQFSEDIREQLYSQLKI
jgi:hypothetical protein